MIDKYVMQQEIFSKADDQPKVQFPCRQQGCGKTYIYQKACETHEKKMHRLVWSSSPSSSTTTVLKQDSMKDHSEARLGFSFLLLDMMDAVKEGDGERLM